MIMPLDSEIHEEKWTNFHDAATSMEAYCVAHGKSAYTELTGKYYIL